MAINLDEMKTFNLRIPKYLWLFLKAESAEKETPMGGIVVDCVERYKKRMENKLTKKNANV